MPDIFCLAGEHIWSMLTAASKNLAPVKEAQ